MVKSDKLGKIEVVALEHDFETEVRQLVTQNHRITLTGIQQAEDEQIAYIEKELAGADKEFIRSEISHAGFFFDDLKRAANHMALVALVTRMDHWTRKLVKQLSLRTDKNKMPVVRDMEALNARLGIAPIPIQFFKELVTVRDSVIHADSQVQWEFKGPRRVADRYVDCEELNFTEQHLTEATKKVKTQVKWYDEHVAAESSSKKPRED